MLRRALLPALLVALATTAACGGGSDDEAAAPASDKKASGTVVKMPLLAFDPAEVSLKKGETLTWENSNDIEHVLVQGAYETDMNGQRTKESDDGAFELKVAKKGDTVSHTYGEAGTFPYYCTIHKAMNGTVTVTG